jgi:hypothetical protein
MKNYPAPPRVREDETEMGIMAAVQVAREHFELQAAHLIKLADDMSGLSHVMPNTAMRAAIRVREIGQSIRSALPYIDDIHTIACGIYPAAVDPRHRLIDNICSQIKGHPEPEKALRTILGDAMTPQTTGEK